MSDGSEGETGDDDMATTSLGCLDLALRLHRQVTLAREAGRGDAAPHRQEMLTPEGGEDEEGVFEEQGENRCNQCGKRLPNKPSAADLLRHKKYCS